MRQSTFSLIASGVFLILMIIAILTTNGWGAVTFTLIGSLGYSILHEIQEMKGD